MEMMERSYSLLLVSASEKFNLYMRNLLPESRYRPVQIATDAAQARRCFLETPYDVVVINAPLPDDFGAGLALDLCENSGAGVLLLVKADHFADLQARLSPLGALVLSKPTNAQMVSQSLLLLCATRERLRRMEQKTASMEEKMEEIRIVNRAKWQLIDQLKMTEKEAHRYIEKQAMDRCVTRRVIAEGILATYK